MGEQQYLNLIRDVLEGGDERIDRTGVGTIARFGCSMRFDLSDSFPLLTTKKVFWRGVVEELLWFISGSTSAHKLHDRGIKIWDEHGSRRYLDKLGIEREEGDLGPIYGFQWRHFGAKYIDMHTDYTGQGVDQLAQLIETLKTNPTDRRLILSAWNPADLSKMALPPCHMFAQFYVSGGKLSCQLYQRSCDIGLGVPFNIASYALLTYMIAHVVGLGRGELIHVMGDTHIYGTHIESLKVQMSRKPREPPRLRIVRDVQDIDSFGFDDFELIGYEPHPTIPMDMAV
jgi:thymidylate synthase